MIQGIMTYFSGRMRSIVVILGVLLFVTLYLAIRLSRPEQLVNPEVFDTVMAFGGSISAEHGVGRLKRDELARLRPPAATETMRAIKRALDPLGIMNPGRVVSV